MKLRKALCTAFFLLMAVTMSAQGINFMPEGSTFKEAVIKAKKENKLIFLDCYTSWCGPCRMMATKVFTQQEVGDFMNPSYVCIKIDMEKGEGPELNKKLEVSAFPTFIIFNANGGEVGRFVGGSQAEEFIQRVKDHSVDKGSQEMDQRFENGERSEAFLYEYLNTLSNAYKRKQCSKVAEILLEGKAETFAADSTLSTIFMKYVSNPFCPAFIYTAKHPEALEKAIGDVPVQMKLNNVWNTYPRTLITPENGTVTLDEESLNNYLALMKECGLTNGEHYRLTTYISYAEQKKDWPLYMQYVQEYWNNPTLDVEDFTLCRWCTPLAKECKDQPSRDAMVALLRQRVDDLNSGRREPQTRMGNMQLSGNMKGAMEHIINDLSKSAE